MFRAIFLSYAPTFFWQTWHLWSLRSDGSLLPTVTWDIRGLVTLTPVADHLAFSFLLIDMNFVVIGNWVLYMKCTVQSLTAYFSIRQSTATSKGCNKNDIINEQRGSAKFSWKWTSVSGEDFFKMSIYIRLLFDNISPYKNIIAYLLFQG